MVSVIEPFAFKTAEAAVREESDEAKVVFPLILRIDPPRATAPVPLKFNAPAQVSVNPAELKFFVHPVQSREAQERATVITQLFAFELELKKMASEEVGTLAPPPPPDVVDQFPVEFASVVTPIQKRLATNYP